MATIGALTTFVLWVIGTPFPLLFGVLAGLLEVVPLFGPVVATVPMVLVALSEGWTQALMVLGAIVVIQQVESNLLVPLIMGRAVQLHSAVIGLGVLFVGWLLGPLAILMAVPILATTRVLVQDLWVERLERRDDARTRPEETPHVASARRAKPKPDR